MACRATRTTRRARRALPRCRGTGAGGRLSALARAGLRSRGGLVARPAHKWPAVHARPPSLVVGAAAAAGGMRGHRMPRAGRNTGYHLDRQRAPQRAPQRPQLAPRAA